MSNTDIVYLRNVVLKFMEAALAGRVAERDALLPAVATLLQVRSQPGYLRQGGKDQPQSVPATAHSIRADHAGLRQEAPATGGMPVPMLGRKIVLRANMV
jgi:hypothetical protein